MQKGSRNDHTPRKLVRWCFLRGIVFHLIGNFFRSNNAFKGDQQKYFYVKQQQALIICTTMTNTVLQKLFVTGKN